MSGTRGAWHDIHDPLVRDLVGRASERDGSAAFPVAAFPVAPDPSLVDGATLVAGVISGAINPFLLGPVQLDAYVAALAQPVVPYPSMAEMDAAAQARVTACSGQVVLTDSNDPLPDAIVSRPVGPIALECGECGPDTSVGQPVTTDDDVDPLVIDPIDAMLADHIHIGGVNRIRRHGRG